MNESWKDKTCEKCTFRVGDECHRFPPTATSEYVWNTYPKVNWSINNKFCSACAEYAESLSVNVPLKFPVDESVVF